MGQIRREPTYAEGKTTPPAPIGIQSGSCPFDGPGANASLGPTAASPDSESSALGFGQAIGANTGIPGAGLQSIQAYVRRAICGNGNVEGKEACDDGPSGSANCTADCSIIE